LTLPVGIAWTQGGTATIELLDGERVELSSTRAFAPGSRPEGAATVAGRTLPFWMKVHGSRRQEDSTYRVSGRLLNATRETRERLKEAVSDPNSGKTPTS
jgi:hypothetical protein